MKNTFLFAVFVIAEREYAHFSINFASLRRGILAVSLGVLLASLYAIYVRAVVGAPVRALLAAEAFGEEKSLPLSALSLRAPRFFAFLLRRDFTLRRLVGRVEREDGETLYFIREEDRYRAAVRFEKEGNPALGILFAVVFSLLLAVLLLRLAPILLSIADRLLK